MFLRSCWYAIAWDHEVLAGGGLSPALPRPHGGRGRAARSRKGTAAALAPRRSAPYASRIPRPGDDRAITERGSTIPPQPQSRTPTPPARQPLPAKLARPTASALIPRERLFARLDRAPASRITWISGPGGAGKTSFVSSYVEARGLDCLWYQVDAADADLAVTTHYLRLAVRDRPGEPLPAFTAADYGAFDLFARRFCEAFFARLATPLVIVFDNYQEVARDARFHDLVVALLDHLPEHVRVVALSRAEPPPALAKWSLHPRFAAIDWGEVRFLPEEAAALARNWGIEGTEHVDALLAVSRGWAAGMVLMLRAAQRGFDLREAQHEPPRQLFGYFASQVWSRLPAATQAFLCRTAFLPHITAASAQALTGEARAGRILADLHTDNLFTDRRPGAEPVYEYHPLFREFLAGRAAEALDPAALGALKGRTAALLEEAGELAAAADLLIGAADWASLAAFVERRAERMVDQARFHTLRSWLDALPAGAGGDAPWLTLWLGVCKAVARDATFRAALEASAARFDAAGDLVGSCAARGWLFQTAASAAALERLLAEVRAQYGRHGPVADPRVEARIIRNFNADYRLPARDPQWLAWVDRADRLARELPDPGQRVRMAAFAGLAYAYAGDIAKLRSVVEAARADLPGPGVTVRDRYVFLNVSSSEAYLRGELAAARAESAPLSADPGSNALDQMGPVLLELRHAVAVGDRQAIGEWQARLDEMQTFVTRMRGNHLQYSTLARLALGDLDRAWSDAAELASIMTPRSLGFSMSLANLAIVQLVRGEDEPARATLEHAVAAARESNGPVVLFPALQLLAVAEQRLGRTEEATAHLREAMRLARETQCVIGRPLLSRPLFVEVVELALANGIEVEHARTTVTRLGLRPRSAAVPGWPWPLAIRTLGRFELARDGAPLEVHGKAQKKPLELLKALVALGAEGVDAARLAALLWPDAEGDAAKHSFDTTLYRLRKLLGRDDLLVLAEGKLSLDRGQCWLDVRAFEQAARDADADPAAGELARLGRAVLDAYPGHFLAADEDAPWAVELRDRLRSKLVRTVLGLGERLQAAGRWAEAVALYERTLERDNLNEGLYRSLMICQRTLGQTAAALQAYRRCRELLSVVLGVAPSVETEAVRRSLDAGS
jgi:LuxR family transcriptional regulator, maltose regulon positive regulatory protein